ncbi:cytochrome b [Hoeflea prorocentri]|uniref:Cytochrome b/b6 domain-containing protein n=1 Tax=Hoeflea prorocentri TaxID=1922333 RepID=A0A9X3UMN8_9HYPH|nr:cytochrome b/b6 domain-containing protein [Hoeflea prorocentri]MCY6383366.1 cytochrome b/b6 domain-containing protein [Hoeflea prorocentri]MDA5401166.1 cytochrome b/b6 domain-containing protein [Hoeflea prorocentri]
MRLKSTSTQYGVVAVSIHWISAALILALIASGFVAEATQPNPTVLRIHIGLGGAILMLTVLRLAWWLFADSKPANIPGSGWQVRLSGLVHILFYVVIFGMAASGIGMLVLSNALPVLIDGTSATLPDFDTLAPRRAHGFGARLMIALLILHTGAALYHHVFKRDGTLQRMWFARS